MNESNVAKRDNNGKVPMHLLSVIALEGCAKVLGFGANKYAANAWRKGLKQTETAGSLLRHLFKYLGGENIDPESELPHLDHVLCNAMFLSEMYHTRPDMDDRFLAEPKLVAIKNEYGGLK